MNFSTSFHVPEGLDVLKLPKHVAIIMDGNGRWAEKRLMNRIRGHEAGAETVRTIIRTCREIGISILTLYAFSTENWRRPKIEVATLMMLLKKFIESEQNEMIENNIRLNAIGELADLPADVRESLGRTMDLTKSNDGMVINLALSYGGRAEIANMVKILAEKARVGELDPVSITEEFIADHLYTVGMPDPDLLIRTSGEMRISNFLLWQIAYTEIFITDTLWPDFGRDEFVSILIDFQSRERRFGNVV